jgi:hypothetical protein
LRAATFPSMVGASREAHDPVDKEFDEVGTLLPMGSVPRRRTLIWVVYACLVAVLFEGASALFVTYALPRFKPYYFADFYDRMVAEISDAKIASFARDRHDPELGWDYRPDERMTIVDEFGHATLMTTDANASRTLPVEAGPGLIAAYGDSFTAGSNVNDDETWEYFLSRLTGTRVANFGVAGYGPDQALLKLERNFRRGLRAKIVILAIIPDDLNRLLSVYRPFYARAEPGVTFKPMFRGQAGAMEVVNLAPRPLTTRTGFLQAFEQAKHYDYWYACRARAAVTPRFPYSLTVAQALVLRPFLKRACPAAAPEAGRVMSYLLERFHAHAVANHYVPILVIIPEEAAELVAGKSKIDPALLAMIEAEFAGRIKVVDLAPLALRRPLEPRKYNIGSGRGHLSADGNRLVATLLEDQLRPLIEQARREMAMAR